MTDKEAMAELDKLLDVPFVFWLCPRGCNGRVEWNADCTQAKCLECGLESEPRDSGRCGMCKGSGRVLEYRASHMSAAALESGALCEETGYLCSLCGGTGRRQN